jgi:hypothetical protein
MCTRPGGGKVKDHLRDYATEAFRLYARCNQPLYDDMHDAIYKAAMESPLRELGRIGSGIGKPTEQAMINAERAVEECKGMLNDILAVENARKIMRPEWWRAVEIVYFTDPDRPLEKGDIEARVHRAEIEIPAGRATVYRFLKKARKLFAIERGLRI